MLYAVKRADGELEIIRLIPQRVVASDQTVTRVTRTARLDEKQCWRWTYENGKHLDIPFSVINEFGDCKTDTLPGLVVEFPTPAEITKQRPELAGATWAEIATADLPPDRSFRAAWELNGKTVAPNMTKARDIHMDRIRKARDAELAKLDVDMMRAMGQGDNTARDAVEAKKQVLRDLPATFDLRQAMTPEELKSLWPKELAASSGR